MAKVANKVRQQLRANIYRSFKVAHEYVALADDDMRRLGVCSNHKSDKCGRTAPVAARANKVYCETCYERTNKARLAIVARADVTLANLIAAVEADEVTVEAALALTAN